MTASLKKDQTLVSALAEERRRQGLTQEALAARMHTKQPFLARMEHTHRARIETLQKYAQGLGKRITWVIEDAEPGKG